ncbi:site-specific integrase [Novosphingobium profundi]|uniref:tyrosine-type recombinase/integrase n=1 Tax=Novosphingobium profundi TaxID=1774954 RepID=UPI001BDAB372|nr:site-specific integrase [Novosphingobium profundi]MBT0671290.1 site-specific integrase [Novosphingobium profundi]
MRAPVISDVEFETLFAFAAQMERPEMYGLMILMTKKLGLRPMELAGMETSWFVGNELRIPLGHSKRKQGRSLPIDLEIKEALRVHMGNKAGRVFTNSKGAAFTANGVSEAMRRIYRLAGVQGSCYSGRRTMATKLVDNKVNLLVVQGILGHASVATTQKYVGVTDTMMRNALFG